MLIALLAGIAAGMLMKGSLRNFLCIKFNKPWLIIIAVLLSVPRYISLESPNAVAYYGYISIILTYACIFLFIFTNRKYYSFYIIAAGTFLNTLVMAVNNFKMPVSFSAARKIDNSEFTSLIKAGKDIKHIFMNGHTRLAFLGDIIYVPRSLGSIVTAEVISAGDIVLAAGLMIFVINVMTIKRSLVEPVGSRTANPDEGKAAAEDQVF